MRIIILSVFFAAIAIISCNNKSSVQNNNALVVASDTAKVKYQCPMKCEGDTAYTTPGKCPVCKMELEKK